jgi:phenylalanyl-tRNA synthetase beta chain
MLTSLRWLNRLLEPSNLGADEAEAKLIAHSFPLESREDKPTPEGPDTLMDVEVTSNRGDCLCHLGLARELAATTGRKLRSPDCALPATAGKPRAADLTSVVNESGPACPRFTVRVIRGVKVGPSPAWLVNALESVGQRSINNVVDVSNFVLHEIGHPSHTFDLKTLRGQRLVVRPAKDGETLVALDKRSHTLKSTDTVVADAERAVSLAGVIGGLETGVTEKTTDVLLEMATWDPVAVRRTARRLDIRTDASHRFERIVAAGDLEWASARAARLILDVAGGELCDGMIDIGSGEPTKRTVTLRAARLEHLLGKRIDDGEVKRLLGSIGIALQETATSEGRAVWTCTIPHHRPDLLREVDIIEEVARLHGLDQFAISDTIAVRLDMNQPLAWSNREKATAAVARTLTGQGYFETVTFSFAPREHAEMFVPSGLRTLKVDEARRPGTPYLRPSIIPSLLTVRRANQDALVRPPAGESPIGGGVRLFEIGAVFAETDDGKSAGRQTKEQRHVGLLIDAGNDAETNQRAVRAVRGTIEQIVHALGRASATVTFEPMPAPFAGVDALSCASVKLNGNPVGYLALTSRNAERHWGLDERCCVAELCLGMLIDVYPGTTRVSPLPAFPGIERDLSVVVDETIAWAKIDDVIAGANLDRLEARRFVGVYRDPKKLGPGKKSLTLRLAFRDGSRTLRHEEVDPQVAAVVSALKSAVGAELRA